MNRVLKMKRCRICARDFTPISSMSKVCSVPCSLEWARKLSEKKCLQESREGRKAVREARSRVKTRSDHLREAQAAFNAWVRARDEGLPCISCGRHHEGRWHAGHYRSVGSAPELRFEPLNVHLQCAPCNLYLSGNLTAYRINLIEKIGLEKVQWLETAHAPLKLTIEQIEQMKKFYRAEVRRIKKEM
ncbi:MULTISPECIES: recombination protein NinG [Burkholderia]|uniref:NinG protein n=1 Tax=Burkholderia pyrrocinia TaxID=60550 RepID=A0A318J1X4_BURPY|nr:MULTISPECIES: recombination protein NinG [Burkholderia]PXX41103.1 NinG protein [Burkholderia pyrrocinia]SFW58294.1 Bacteriophage Lambda NinG protein [Burkholderia sp. NFACC33-1]SFY11589.1 Bacteriophage Lambda NinG protein [Burkholderia sp. NFPP32]